MSPSTLAVLVVFLGVFAGVAVLAVRRPLLARLAAREAVRRRGQTLLVVGGLMVGSAGITAALVGADSAQDSAVLNAYRTWNMVDITVTWSNRLFPSDVVSSFHTPRLSHLVDGVQPGIDLIGSAADLDRRQGEPGVNVMGFDPATQAQFGPFRLVDGRTTLGADLGPNGVLLSRQLADSLEARLGDRLRIAVDLPGVLAPTKKVEVEVAGIARSEGPGSYGLRPTVFAPLGVAQRFVGTGAINVVRISARGGLETGVAGADRAYPVVRRIADGLSAPHGLRVRKVKEEEIQSAKEGTSFTRYMLIGMSMLIVAAGAALVVNLATMLAEERRPRLAVLRALGLTRGGLVSLSVLEGAIYSLLAAAAGTALGVLAGRLVAQRFASAFAQFLGSSVDLHFVLALHPATLAAAFAAGSLITLGTVLLAARRTSRMSIPAAIRNLPEPATPAKRRWPRRFLLWGGALLGVAGVLQGDDFLLLLGGLSLIVVGALVVRHRLPERAHATVTGLVLAAWAFLIVYLTRNTPDPGKFFQIFTVAVLAAVFGMSIATTANLKLVERAVGLLGRLSRGLRPTLRPPLAYLARRPLRTGITTGVFAVVIAILSLLAVFLSIFKPQYQRDSAGYDVRVVSTGVQRISLPSAVRPLIAREAPIRTLGYVGSLKVSGFSSGTIFLPLHELSGALLRNPPVHLTSRASQFKSPEAVWHAIRSNPRWIVSNFGTPGDAMVLEGPAGTVRLRVAANQQGGVLTGVIGTPRSLAAFSNAPVGETLLLDVRNGVSSLHVARSVERSLFALGVDATTTKSLLDKTYRANKTFFSVIQVLMQMGLVVGILALGILALRAVVERRHVIGVLRAIGYARRRVMLGLMAEAGVSASIGVVVGVVAGLVMGFIYYVTFNTGSGFGVDGPTMWGSLVVVYVAVFAVTVVPAWRASRLPPAEAVRHTE